MTNKRKIFLIATLAVLCTLSFMPTSEAQCYRNDFGRSHHFGYTQPINYRADFGYHNGYNNFRYRGAPGHWNQYRHHKKCHRSGGGYGYAPGYYGNSGITGSLFFGF